MRQRLGRLLILGLAWAFLAVPVSLLAFANSSESTNIASHDAVVSPAFDGYATLDLGPYLPNLRYPTGYALGADVRLGKTNLSSYEALIQRYAVIGSQPEGEIAKLRSALSAMAVDSAVTGALIGLLGPAALVALGRRRREELFHHLSPRRVGYVGLAGVVVAVAVLQPWSRRGDESRLQGEDWVSVADELPDVPVPEEAARLEIESGLMTTGTKRLAESAFDSYRRSVAFYEKVVSATPELADQLHRPADDETVALLVSDRHDNIGMDAVARAIADQGGATMLLDAGDDTSTGSPWEAFSLDSLHQAFRDYDHLFAVAGNHDNGDFVPTYLDDLGFTTFEGELVDGPDDIRLLGSDDPRSSGLGSWRDEVGLSFGEHAERVADEACAYDEDGERVSTLLVHDANTGRDALTRGCVDLVVGGHIHAQLGPTRVVGENGKAGYTYTNGTTGGAAYAVAIGSKLRRDAQVTLVTYREGRPVGLQPVSVRTVGDFVVGPYTELDLDDEAAEALPGPETTNDPSGDESP